MAPESDLLGFWGEYEAPTHVRDLTRRPSGGLPAYAHTPLPLAGAVRPPKALNSDPLVLGSPWVYSNCRQRSCERLRHLERGDLILFGSLVGRAFVLDTVFVVAQAIPHGGAGSAPQVAPHVRHLVLDLVKPGEYTLYTGASYAEPVAGMFSFVPAVPVLERPLGFARPPAPASLQSLQAMGVKYLDAPQDPWQAVAEAVLGQGLSLGVGTSLPG